MQFVEPFSIDRFERSCGNDFARHLFRLWRQNKGGLPPEPDFFAGVGSEILVLAGGVSQDHEPSLLYAGEDAFAVKIMGTDWPNSPENAAAALDDEYRRMVVDAYGAGIASGEPIYDLVSGCVQRMQLRYERLILPFDSISGARFMVCMSMGVDAVSLETGHQLFQRPPLIGSLRSGHP